MKDFFTAFFQRFTHPILYSVLTSLIVWNFDHIYQLLIAPFHTDKMSPVDVVGKFVSDLKIYRCDRLFLPLISGITFGTIILPLVDIGYSTLIAFAMSIKEKGINWSKRSSWSYKISDARRISVCLAESWEEPDYWVKLNKLTSGTQCYLFRCSMDVNLKDIVVYNQKKNQIEAAAKNSTKILGIVYQIFYENLALVVTEGSIIDENFIYMFAKEPNGAWELNLNSSGKIRLDSLDITRTNPDRVATIRPIPRTNNQRELMLIRTNLDPEAVTLPINKRLFGEDEVKLNLL